MLSGKTSIVIIGAGSAGASIAKSLSGSLDASQHEIVLISPQLYYIHYPSTPRMVVTDAGKLEDQGLVPLDKLFLEGNRKFVQGEAALIDEQAREVELMTGRKVSFDFLVLATGTRWGGPIAFPHDPSKVRRGFIEEKRREFREAKNILLVGGGSVGIELAGELRDLSSESLSFTATDYFSTPYPDKMRNYMQEQLENRKIEVILGDSVDVPTSGPYQGTITTGRGKRLSPDLIVHTRGGRPNTEVIAASLGSDVLTERGPVKVKPTTQLEDRTNIFATVIS